MARGEPHRGQPTGEEGSDIADYQRAIDDYTQALNISPDYADAYYNRGIAYYDLGNYQSAIDDYTRSIEIKPNCADTYVGRGTAFIS